MVSRHLPVLLHEVVEMLSLRPGMNIIDCTLGDAGHTEEILKKITPGGRVLGIDADKEAHTRARNFLKKYEKQVVFAEENFVNLEHIVNRENFRPVNGILLDLGWSTPQFEERGRGFSFLKDDEPLDMRYGKNSEVTAAELVNTFSEAEIEKILREYGEEKLSREIAKNIVLKRKQKSIKTVGDLGGIILETYRHKLKTDKEIPWVGGLHPATKVFQALRIAVNNELGVLESVLLQAERVLTPGGRLLVISFHSLEDRIVKHFFKSTASFNILTKKPLTCGESEYELNPRARSAKLRVVEKL